MDLYGRFGALLNNGWELCVVLPAVVEHHRRQTSGPLRRDEKPGRFGALLNNGWELCLSQPAQYIGADILSREH